MIHAPQYVIHHTRTLHSTHSCQMHVALRHVQSLMSQNVSQENGVRRTYGEIRTEGMPELMREHPHACRLAQSGKKQTDSFRG